MKRRASGCVLLGLVVALCAFWWDDEPSNPDKVAVIRPMSQFDQAKLRLEQAFSGGGPASQKALAQALTAFQQDDYEGAVLGLLALAKTPNRRFEDWQAYYSVYMGLERDVIAGIQAGHQDAAEAAKMMRELPCCVR
jgi:hypothetical protein